MGLNNRTLRATSGAMMIIAGITAVWFACSSRNGPRFVSARELSAVLDLSTLTPIETKRLEKVVNNEVSPCGDNVTIAQALYNPEHCPLIIPAIRFILRKVKNDFNVEEISTDYVTRFAIVKGMVIPVESSPTAGAADPIVTIVVFTDFECPFCARAAEKLHEILLTYPEDVNVVYKHYPIDSHRHANHAARAAFAAQNQNKFWEMHDTLFTAIGSPLNRERIDIMAEGLGLDMVQFREDMNSAAATAAIAADKKLGAELGVTGTPTLFVNGRILTDGIGKIDERLEEEFLRYGPRRQQDVQEPEK